MSQTLGPLLMSITRIISKVGSDDFDLDAK